jgi:hypothetical protein
MADFKFQSPTVKSQIIDRSFASPTTLGITSVGIAGETLKGPAFSPVLVTDKSIFRRIFGGTSTEKYPDGSQKMKYLGPTYANAFLEEGNQLYFVRILGKSGFNAGKGWAITVGGSPLLSTSGLSDSIDDVVSFSGTTFLGLTITGDGEYNNLNTSVFVKNGNIYEKDEIYLSVSGFSLSAETGTTSYTALTYTAETNMEYDNMVVAILRSRGSGLQDNVNFNVSSITADLSNTFNNPFGDIILSAVGTNVNEVLVFNLNSASSNFISKTIGNKNSDSKSNLYIEAIYPDLIKKLVNDNKINSVENVIELNTNVFADYKSPYKNSETPWVVSELNGNKISRLFKFVMFTDGDNSNKQVKFAIENINPTTKEFDIVVRDFNDTDENLSILERFSRCTMNPNDSNFIMKKIGGVFNDSENTFLEDARSEYFYVNVNINASITSIPCGFEGYELRSFTNGNTGTLSAQTTQMIYKTGYTTTERVARTYLGLSEKAFDGQASKGLTINPDLFKFYGTATDETTKEKTKGFHLDSGATDNYTDSDGNVLGEFVTGVGSITDSSSVVAGTYYADILRRKFTFVPYGGFDGWDVNYEIVNGRSINNTFSQGGLNAFDNSDYNAYLEGYKVFEDTEATPINLFVTPGINWSDNTNLVKEALQVVEEVRQDCLYIIDAPDANLNDIPSVVAETYSDDITIADIDSSYAASYVPYVKRKDPDSNTNIFIPPTGEILKAMALSDRTTFIWFATAGTNRGGLPNVRDIRKNFKEADRDRLYLNRLNPIVKFTNNTPGIFIYGQKTLQVADSKLDRIDVKRLLLYSRQIITAEARKYLFEPNDEVLVSEFIAEANKKLKVIQDNRGLQTFSVRLDNTLNTPESRDRNEIYFVIELLPIGAVEFIGLTFVVNKSNNALEFNS